MKVLRLALCCCWSGAEAIAQTPPQPPQAIVDTTYAPGGGTVRAVNSGGSLQAAIDASSLGLTPRNENGGGSGINIGTAALTAYLVRLLRSQRLLPNSRGNP